MSTRSTFCITLTGIPVEQVYFFYSQCEVGVSSPAHSPQLETLCLLTSDPMPFDWDHAAVCLLRGQWSAQDWPPFEWT